MTVVWEVIAFLAALFGGWLILSSLGPEYSAPQTAAQAAVGIGIAAIPYFIASMAQRSDIMKRLKNLSPAREKEETVVDRVKDFLVGRD